MKLFLASSGLEYIKKFVGGDPARVRMLFIPTAGNLDKDVWWIDKDRDVLAKMGFQITELDISTATQEDMKTHLDASDIVYVAGGNTFYLLKQLQDTGFGDLLKKYIAKGGLYAGASAGAIIAGPDIGPISSIEEPELVNGLTSTAGLGLVNIVPVPHYDMTARTQAIDKIKDKYRDTYEMVLLTDDQAIEVSDEGWKMVESPRSALEMEWFTKNNII